MKEDLAQTHSIEVTGLGMVLGVIIASGSLVGEGSFELSHYLVFLGFMLVGAGALLWRILSPSPVERAKSREQLHP